MRSRLIVVVALGSLAQPIRAQQISDLIANNNAPAAAPAELPRATVATDYPSGGRPVRVPANGNLQAAIDAARPGDVLLLAPGAIYVGNFSLRNKGPSPANAPAGGWIVIRTDVPDAALGREGTRMTPTRSASLRLARVQSPDYSPAFGSQPGAHHYRLTALDISAAPSAKEMNMIIRFGESGETQRSVPDFPHDLIVDRSFVHGTPRLQVKRCLTLNSNASAVVDSWFADCHSNNGDSQAVLSYNSTGPLKIQNNHLEAGHEIVAFGGSDPHIPGLSPSDVEVRGNHITRPVEWKKVWQVKNLIETKNVRRLLIEGNVIENNWADGQDGFAIVLKSENQDGSAPWSTSSDITFRNNRLRNTGSAFNLSGTGSSPARVIPATRFTITNNIIEGMNVGPFQGEGIAYQLLNGLSDAIITHNTMLNQRSVQSTVVFDGFPIKRLVMHSNVFFNGVYGVHGGGTGTGSSTLQRYAPNAVFRRNAIVGADCREYPPGTICPENNVLGLGFTNPISGNYRVKNGALKGNAFDKGDIGADVDAVENATRGAVVLP